MKKVISFILPVSFGLMISSCSKDKVNFVPLSKIAKQYCDFKVGSYWVYEDSLSGAIDSVFLYNRDEQIIGNGAVKREKISYDYYSSYLYQSNPNTLGKEVLARELTVTGYPNGISDSVNTVFYAPRYYLHQIYSDAYQNVSDFGDGATDVILVNEYDSIDINSNRFYNVKEFANNQMRSFFAKNIGLIQFFEPHYPSNTAFNHNWKLIRYSIQ